MIRLKNGDLVGIPPSNWFSKIICKILGAKTFHWLMIIGHDRYGYITSESLGKGTSVSRFVYPVAYIYRIKGLKEPTTMKLISLHSQYGDAVYDMQVNFLTALWFLLKYFLGVVIPIIKNAKWNCQEWVVCLSVMLGFKIIPDDQYPDSINLENSEQLFYIGKYEIGGNNG